MATIQRPVKTFGTRSYATEVAAAPNNEAPILSSEVDADLDTIYTAWNTPANRFDWVTSGANNITPSDATKIVAIPGPTAGSQGDALVFGTRPVKGRLNVNQPGAAADAARLTINRNNPAGTVSADDNAQATWEVCLRAAGGDDFRVLRSAAGSPATQTTPLYVQGSDGKTYCTLADASVTKPMMVGGATVRNETRLSSPSSFTLNTYDVFVLFVTFPALVTNGGLVLLFINHTLGYNSVVAGAANAAIAIFRDGTNILQTSQRFSGAVVQGLRPLMGYDLPAAGSHVYDVRVMLQSGTSATITASGWGGDMIAREVG